MKTPDALKALAALAHETRLAIFRMLVQAGTEGLSVGVIGERLKLPGATLSFHLKELASASMVHARQDGRFVFYRAHYEHMNGLLAYLTENCCQGGDCGTGCAPSGPRRKRVIA
jgi:ArsR family transcriptional regulator